MACANMNMDIHQVEDAPHRPQRPERRGETPFVRHYQATEFMPSNKGPLHDLLKKQPAVLGSLQVVSGLLSVGVGIIFAVTQDMSNSLFSMFRVSQLTGALFIIAGLVSNALFKYPELLPVSFLVNCGCICVALVSVPLIIVDLTEWDPQSEHLKMEVLQLCVLGLELSLSTILCFWFFKEKRKSSK